jgi:type VI secretion system protein ImpK
MATAPTAAPDAVSPDVADAFSGAYQIHFQRIYEEVVKEARQVADAAERPDEAPACRDVQQRLFDFIERVAGDALHLSPSSERRRAFLVMVAMADEVFLRSPDLAKWAGRAEWAERPLEQLIFGSHSAGEQFFALLDDSFDNRALLSRDLYAVFLTALALGFCGRYDKGDKPDEYRARIADRIGHEPARQAGAAEGDGDLFRHEPPAPGKPGTLPSVMNGVYPILAVVALWLVAGLVVWQVTTFQLNRTLDNIERIR